MFFYYLSPQPMDLSVQLRSDSLELSFDVDKEERMKEQIVRTYFPRARFSSHASYDLPRKDDSSPCAVLGYKFKIEGQL